MRERELRARARARRSRSRNPGPPSPLSSRSARARSLEEFQDNFALLSVHDQLLVPDVMGLIAYNFTSLWHAKLIQHLRGTREWAFVDIGAWLDEPDASQLFWLMCVGTREAARGRPV